MYCLHKSLLCGHKLCSFKFRSFPLQEYIHGLSYNINFNETTLGKLLSDLRGSFIQLHKVISKWQAKLLSHNFKPPISEYINVSSFYLLTITYVSLSAYDFLCVFICLGLPMCLYLLTITYVSLFNWESCFWSFPVYWTCLLVDTWKT